MSSSLAMHGARRWIGLALALAGAVAAFAAIVPAAQADFTTGKCLGSNVTGRGASFANAAHTAWETNFQNSFCADVGIFPDMTYDPAGSGAGRRVMGERTAPNADGSLSRNQVPRYGMTDEPPTLTAVSQMNQGTDAVGDEGTTHVIPGRDRLGRAGRQLARQLRPRAAAGLRGDQPGGRERGSVHRPRALHAHPGGGDLERRLGPRRVGRDLPEPHLRPRVHRVHHPRRPVRRLGHVVRVQDLARQGQPDARLGPGLHVRPRHAQLAERVARSRARTATRRPRPRGRWERT